MLIKLRSAYIKLVNKNDQLRQVIVYLLVGGTSAASDIVFLFILVDLFHIWYVLASVISFITIATTAFFFHMNYTFKFTGERKKLRYLIFLLTAGSGLLWNVSILYFFVEFLNIWYLVAAVITKFIVLFWNFGINKFVTFR